MQPLPQGLTSTEASRLLAIHGRNIAARARRGQRFLEFAQSLLDPMAIMLAVAGAAYFAMGERLEGAVLFAALIPVLGIDVILGFRSQAALKKLAASVAAKARVIRDGRETEISSEILVPGDILVLAEGDIVHGDATVLSASNLATDESQLTGESEARTKRGQVPGEREAGKESRVYVGSRVLVGHGLARVTATGASSQYGEIASLVGQAISDRTPLERKVAVIVRWTATAGVVLSFVVFFLEIVRGASVGRAFLYGITLAMASVGEEFLLVLTLFLGVGAFRLSRKGVLFTRIACVETLGSTTVICLDKTGTLTAGSYVLGLHQPLADAVSESELLTAAVLACEPQPRDAIEAVILEHCAEHGVDLPRIYREWRIVYDYDFDARGKHMSHVWERVDGSGALIVAKGALEGLLDHGAADPALRERAIEANARLAASGMRVLAVAGRVTTSSSEFTGTRTDDERELNLLGLLGFHDPIRPSVPAAVTECQRAGVALKLVTGDHPLTAHAIADASGLAHRDDTIIIGSELDAAEPARFGELVRQNSIFARMRPDQKYAIVDALIKGGEIVAMTGDGINDAPALRRASIGVSMGKRATEVARSAAGMVLLEDDFAALVAAISEGRHLFNNIQQAFRYLIGFKVMLVGMAFAAPLFGLPVLLTPLNVIWLELIVHPVSALVFEGRDSGEDVMGRPPHRPNRPIASLGAAARSALCGALLAAGAFAAYVLYLANGEAYARSVAMVSAVVGSILLVFAELAAERRWWNMMLPRDARFWTVCLAAVATPVLFSNVPLFAKLLGLAGLSWGSWGVGLAIAGVAVGWRSIDGFSSGHSAATSNQTIRLRCC